MKAKHLMIIGAAGAGVLIAAATFVFTDPVAVPLFAFGALFGKGYGIWEVKHG